MKVCQIYWSPLAKETYLKTLSLILEQWTIKEAEHFEAKVESLIDKLRHQNKLCPPSQNQKNLRRCVISSQTSMVYQTRGDVIEVVAFFDNRSEH